MYFLIPSSRTLAAMSPWHQELCVCVGGRNHRRVHISCFCSRLSARAAIQETRYAVKTLAKHRSRPYARDPGAKTVAVTTGGHFSLRAQIPLIEQECAP